MTKAPSSVIHGLLLCLVMLVSGFVSAQVSVKDSAIGMVMIRPSFALQAPGGDLSTRFGMNQSIGMAAGYKWANGWMVGAEATLFFGSKIKEQGVFTGLTTAEGTIVGVDGLYGDIRLFERGYTVMATLSRLFPVKKPNPNCGFVVETGLGFMQHKIKIDDKKNAVPAVRDPYVKGYDRLTNGIAFKQFIGYLHVGNRRLVNFYGGVEAIQGFTASRRSYNYSTMSVDDAPRIDLLFGLRVGWIIALFKEAPDPFYMY
ncbi:MAG: hypothetical protein ACKOQY_09995 [Bacteroidota bacterium]